MCEKTMRPTYVRASVGSRRSGSWLSATTSVFFCACATPACNVSRARAAVMSESAGLMRRMGDSSRFDVRDGAQDGSGCQTVGHGVGAGDGAPVLRGHAHLVEPRAPSLLDLVGLGDQQRLTMCDRSCRRSLQWPRRTSRNFDAECPGPRVIFEAPAQRGRDDLGFVHDRLSIAG